jgi:hypothetical protein
MLHAVGSRNSVGTEILAPIGARSKGMNNFALPPGLVQRSALLLEGLEVCIFTTSGTCVAFFQATLQFPSHSGLDLAPGPDRAWENVLPGK